LKYIGFMKNKIEYEKLDQIASAAHKYVDRRSPNLSEIADIDAPSIDQLVSEVDGETEDRKEAELRLEWYLSELIQRIENSRKE